MSQIKIRYVEIENFKSFSKKIHIDLSHPAVLIGPNNSGKTSVIQALALWNQGVRSWYEKKGDSGGKTRERYGAGINRLSILDIPVSENRFFWNATKVRTANKSIEMKVNAGIEHDGLIKDCKLVFTYRDTDTIYCKPCPETLKDDTLLKLAAETHFHLLYPMSGIDTEETLLPEGRINVLLGQGQTAQVLRNICFKVVEQDQNNNTNDWHSIADLIERLFMVELNLPVFNKANGTINVTYSQSGVDNPLDISLSGRGLQQVLLILAYLHWRKGSLLLIDEPDAHLEILKQKQIFEILKTVAEKNGCQVVIATHSEVILDDAVDTNLTMLLNGETTDIAKHQDMKNALRNYGIEHYYKAKIHPRILYIEGSSDIDMLKALAEKINHTRATSILSGVKNCYYTRNIEPENSFDNTLDRVSGAYSDDFVKHFYALKAFVPELKGFAIFDSDNNNKPGKTEQDFALRYWRLYELENYFILPEILVKFAENYYSQDQKKDLLSYASGQSSAASLQAFTETVDECLLESNIFNGDRNELDQYYTLASNLKRKILSQIKMSDLAEKIFRRFSEKQKQPLLLKKGEFYRLIEFVDAQNIPEEVKDTLDLLCNYLQL